MVKKFVVSLVLALACFLTAWAGDIRPQSELVTVLNGKNADGKYVAEYEDGVPVLKFRFVIPDDIDMSDFYCLCMRNYVAGTEANKGFCNLLHPVKNRRNLTYLYHRESQIGTSKQVHRPHTPQHISRRRSSH